MDSREDIQPSLLSSLVVNNERRFKQEMSSSPSNRRISNKHSPGGVTDRPTVYQIRIKGHLGRQWMEWFEGLTIILEENGDTLLTGTVADQAALHGILKKVRDLGMPLLSVNSVVTLE